MEELRAEYQAQTMGPLIVDRVRELVVQYLRRRDPQIYAGGVSDYRDGVEDVLHNFTIDVLLGEGQLAYFIATATTLDGFDRLANFQLRRYLARTRQRTIVDNLIERAIASLEADDLFVGSGEGNQRRFGLAGVDLAEAVPHELELRRVAAVGANAVPRIFSNPDERRPQVYTGDSLRSLLRICLGELRGPVGRSELQVIFEILLTPWMTTLLGLDEAVDTDEVELTPEEMAVVETTARQIVDSWSAEDVVVFRYKLGNTPDAQLAERLGVSRPTAANAKNQLFARLREELGGLESHLRSALLARMAAITDGKVL